MAKSRQSLVGVLILGLVVLSGCGVIDVVDRGRSSAPSRDSPTSYETSESETERPEETEALNPSRIDEVIAPTARLETMSGREEVLDMVPQKVLDRFRPSSLLEARHVIFLDADRASWTGSVAYLVFDSVASAREAVEAIAPSPEIWQFSLLGKVEKSPSGAESVMSVTRLQDGSPYSYGFSILYRNTVEHWLWDARDSEPLPEETRDQLIKSFVQRVEWASG